MQAESAVAPEFDLDRLEPPAPPVGWPRNVAFAETFGVGLDRGLQRGSGVERTGLLARPRADPALSGTAGEIRVGLRLRNRAYRATKSRLTAQRLPMKQGCRFGVNGEFPSLGALDVAVEDKAARVRPLAEKRPGVRKSALVDRCENHRLGIVDLRRGGLPEPQPKKRDRVLGLGKIG
jgi:hypothetical protein